MPAEWLLYFKMGSLDPFQPMISQTFPVSEYKLIRIFVTSCSEHTLTSKGKHLETIETQKISMIQQRSILTLDHLTFLAEKTLTFYQC